MTIDNEVSTDNEDETHTLEIPINSRLHAYINSNISTLESLKYKNNGGYYCPLPHCWFNSNIHHLQNHLRTNHIDPSAELFDLDDNDEYQPVELKGTNICVIRATRRALCRASMVALRRQEIPYHICACRGCSSASWHRPDLFPKIKNITNKPVDEDKEIEYISCCDKSNVDDDDDSSSSSLHCSYKLHEFFVDPVLLFERPVKRGIIINKDPPQIFSQLNVTFRKTLWRPLYNMKLPFQNQLLIHITELARQIDICTVGTSQRVVSRIDPLTDDSIVVADLNEYFSSQLRYEITDAVECEVRLNGIKRFGFDTENARLMRRSTLLYLGVLLKCVYRETKLEPRPRMVDADCTGQTAGFHYKNGKLYSGEKLLPWCISELVARYFLLVRPLQQKYDHNKKNEDYCCNKLFPKFRSVLSRELDNFYSSLSYLHIAEYGQLFSTHDFKKNLANGYVNEDTYLADRMLAESGLFLVTPYVL